MNSFVTTPRISPETISKRLREGYDLDLGSYIAIAWEIFKKEWLIFTLYSLIVLIIVGTIIGALFIYPLYIGFFLGAEKVAKGEPLALGDMFAGFNHRLTDQILLFLIPLIVLGLLYIPIFAFMLGAGIVGEEATFVGVLGILMSLLFFALLFAVSIVLTFATFFAPYLIYFGDYSVKESLKTSWALSKKNLLMIFLFSLVVGLIAEIGILACFVGIFATLAIGYLCYFPLMKDILFEEKMNPDDLALTNV